MTGSIFKQLAAVTAGTTLIFALGKSIPAQAATISYNFSNTSKTLTGFFSFDQAAVADDQQATVAEGLKIVANYGGQTFTEADYSNASVWSDFSGKIANQQFLGLEFIIPDKFSVYRDSFIDATSVESVNYSSVPEPASILGLSVIGIGLLVGKKSRLIKSANTKA